MTDRSRLLGFAAFLLGAWLPLQQAPPAGRVFDVVSYTATVQPNIQDRSLRGQVRIQVRLESDAVRTIELDRGELTVDAVRGESGPLDFEQVPRRLRIQLGAAARGSRTREITIDYHGAPRSGLQFVPDRSQAYTVFSTSQWLVCLDAPDDKATLQLDVVLPPGHAATASGKFVTTSTRGDGMLVQRWRQDRPMSTYTFGFAIGRFDDVMQVHGHVRLRYLSDGFSRDEIDRMFRDTGSMLDFFEKRAGMPYPGEIYTQVLVANTVGQEAAGFSLLSDAYGRAVLADSTAAGLIAHELAHQWWGNLVTCRDWTHFWLNEGVATFIAAAWTEERFGRDAYLREIERIRTRYEQVRRDGGDKPLVFPSWDRPTANDRTIVYQKGAYVLHLLREQLGERAFWAGVRDYTRRYAGQSVDTGDFQQAMERSSGQTLTPFFARWVYTVAPAF